MKDKILYKISKLLPDGLVFWILVRLNDEYPSNTQLFTIVMEYKEKTGGYNRILHHLGN